MLIKKDTEIKQLKKAQERQKTKFNEIQTLFSDTLNVKLRYEQIIKNLMENDLKKSKNRQTVVEIIKSTKPTTMVVSSKALKSQSTAFTSQPSTGTAKPKSKTQSCVSLSPAPRFKSITSSPVNLTKQKISPHNGAKKEST